MPKSFDRLALGVLIVALTAGAAAAENWYPFYMRPAGAAYLDKDSIILRPGHVSVRMESAYPAPQRLLRKGKVFVYKRTKDLLDIDCRANIYRVLSRDLYSEDGVMQISINEDAEDPLMIVQDSPQAALAAGYCQKAR